MATTKTLKPTGQSVTIPAMSDRPNQGTNSDTMGKTVDAVNALNDMFCGGTIPTNTNLNDITDVGFYLLSTNNTYTNLPAGSVYALAVYKASATTVTIYQIAIGTKKIYLRVRTNATTWDTWTAFDRYGEGWTPSCDVDTLLVPGTYGISANNSYTHLPTGVTSGILEVFVPTIVGTYAMQRLNTGNAIYERYRSGGSGASAGTVWASWYKFTGTAV